MTKKDAICQTLKAIRVYREVSQEKIRQVINIDVSKYETGRCCPGLISFLKICEYFKIHPPKKRDMTTGINTKKKSFKPMVFSKKSSPVPVSFLPYSKNLIPNIIADRE